MRFSSAPIFKTALIYGLLAVSQARPTSLDQDSGEQGLTALERRNLVARVGTPPPRVNAPEVPVKPSTDAPGGPAGLRPGTDTNPAPGGQPGLLPGQTEPGSSGEAGRPPPGTVEELTWRGQRDLAALEKVPANKVGDFKDYDAKMAGYYRSTEDDHRLGLDNMWSSPDTKAFWAKDGVNWPTEADRPPPKSSHSDDSFGSENVDYAGEPMKKVEIYGAPADEAADLNSIFSASVDPNKGLMIRDRQFRSGTWEGNNIDDLYPHIKEADRIHMSDHLAKTWKLEGQGKPLTKFGISKIDNEQLNPALKAFFDAHPGYNKADGIPVNPSNDMYGTVMGSSAGNPLVHAVADYPDTFLNHEPKSLRLTETADGVFGMVTLGPKA